jgi:hypothetical protein
MSAGWGNTVITPDAGKARRDWFQYWTHFAAPVARLERECQSSPGEPSGTFRKAQGPSTKSSIHRLSPVARKKGATTDQVLRNRGSALASISHQVKTVGNVWQISHTLQAWWDGISGQNGDYGQQRTAGAQMVMSRAAEAFARAHRSITSF